MEDYGHGRRDTEYNGIEDISEDRGKEDHDGG